MQNFLQVAESLYSDLCNKCSTPRQQRDLDVLKLRVKHEGLSFLTITLPDFCDDVFLALENGLSSQHFCGFKKVGLLPAFLQGWTTRVFCRDTGTLRSNPTQYLSSIRQFCYAFKKCGLNCTKERIENAYKDYKNTDNDLDSTFQNVNSDDLRQFELFSKRVWTGMFEDYKTENLVFKHGPGAVYEKLNNNQKYVIENSIIYRNIARFAHHMYSSEECFFHANPTLNESDVCSSARLLDVPKTLKGPRIIAVEPTVVQFVQQGIANYLIKKLENSPLTKGHVNFTNQSINGNLALENSRTKLLATLDLSAASDRVHKELVLRMLGGYQDLLADIFDARSPSVDIDGIKFPLKKFSSMGSALCFPIESMFFFTLCLFAKYKKVGKYDYRSFKSIINQIRKNVYVYGDDILVPVDDVDVTRDALTCYGCKINEKKSYKASYFRESCGTDAYEGENITPTYIRSILPRNKGDVTNLISTIETANQFFTKGFELTGTLLRNKVENILGPLPYIGIGSSGLGWFVPSYKYCKTRYNKRLQRWEVSSFVVNVKYRDSKLDGYPALFKSLLRLKQQQGPMFGGIASQQFYSALASDKKHLERVPMRGVITLKRQWIDPRKWVCV